MSEKVEASVAVELEVDDAKRSAASLGEALETAFKKGQEAAKKAAEETDKAAQSARRASIGLYRDYNEAGKRFDHGISDRFRELSGESDRLSNRLQQKFGEVGVTMAAVGLAINEVSRATQVVIHSIGDMAPELGDVNGELSTTDDLLLSLKQTASAPELSGFFEKMAASIMIAAGGLNEVLARVAQLDQTEAARIFSSAASSSLRLDELMASSDLANVNLLGNFDDRVKKRGKDRREDQQKRQREHDSKNPVGNLSDATGEGGVIMLNGVPFDAQTGLPMSPDAPDPESIKSAQAESEARMASWQAKKLELAASVEQGITDIVATNAARREEIRNKEMQAGAAATEHFAETTIGAFGVVLNVAMKTFATMVAGGEVTASQMASDLLKGVGQYLMGRGAADILEGGRRIAFSYGGDLTGEELIGIGGAELVLGGAMMAGGSAFGASSSGGRGGRTTQVQGNTLGSGSGGGSAGFSGGGSGFGGGSSPMGDSSGGNGRVLRIEIQGPMSPAETGAWVKRSLEEAEREGRI